MPMNKSYKIMPNEYQINLLPLPTGSVCEIKIVLFAEGEPCQDADTSTDSCG